MRPERVTEERLELSQGQTDCADMAKDLGRSLGECLELLLTGK
jgi:hypothetical protein